MLHCWKKTMFKWVLKWTLTCRNDLNTSTAGRLRLFSRAIGAWPKYSYVAQRLTFLIYIIQFFPSAAKTQAFSAANFKNSDTLRKTMKGHDF